MFSGKKKKDKKGGSATGKQAADKFWGSGTGKSAQALRLMSQGHTGLDIATADKIARGRRR